MTDTKQLLKAQDENLDELEKGLDRLQEIDLNVKNELKTQKVLINKLDNEVADNNERIGTINIRLRKFIHVVKENKTFTIVPVFRAYFLFDNFIFTYFTCYLLLNYIFGVLKKLIYIFYFG